MRHVYCKFFHAFLQHLLFSAFFGYNFLYKYYAHTMKKYTVFILISMLLTLACGVLLVHKIDFFSAVRFLNSPKIVYVLCAALITALIPFAWKHAQRIVITVRTILLTMLPAMCVLCVGVNAFDTQLHWIFSASVGAYIIALIATYIVTYHNAYHPQQTTAQQPTSKRFYPYALFIISIATVIHLFFGLKDIGTEAYVDERLWVYDRIEQYWDNVLEHDWKNTRPSDKPGITTAIATGPGLLFFDPSDFAKGTEHKERIVSLFTALRTPQFLLITILSLCVFPLVQRLLNTHVAVYVTVFILLSPLLMGMSRIINPDALLWIILFLCFVSFLLYLREHALRWMYLAGILLGFALLTKYIANIFFVFFFLLLFVDSIMRTQLPDNLNRHLKNGLIHYAIMVCTALSVFYILYPGAWVKHDRILLATVHSEAFASTWVYFALLCAALFVDTFLCKSVCMKHVLTQCHKYKKVLLYSIISLFAASVLVVLYNVYTGMSLYDFGRIIESPKSIHHDVSTLALYLTAFFPLLFGVTPLVCISALYALWRVCTGDKSTHERNIVLYTLLFILLYYGASALNNVVPIVRYQIIIYPCIILIASIGIDFLLRTRTTIPAKRILAGVGVIVIGVVQLLHISPFYFSYNSPLLPQKHIINAKDMGDGNYAIATYLNSLPNAEQLLIWTDKRGVCQFFVGACNNMIHDTALITIAPDIDYYVVSQNRQNHITRLTTQKLSRDPHYSIRLDRLYDPTLPKVYEILPNNRPAQFIRIISGDTVTIID